MRLKILNVEKKVAAKTPARFVLFPFPNLSKEKKTQPESILFFYSGEGYRVLALVYSLGCLREALDLSDLFVRSCQ